MHKFFLCYAISFTAGTEYAWVRLDTFNLNLDFPMATKITLYIIREKDGGVPGIGVIDQRQEHRSRDGKERGLNFSGPQHVRTVVGVPGYAGSNSPRTPTP